MNANTSTLTSAAAAATTVTAVELCCRNSTLETYPLVPEIPRTSRTFLGKTTYHGGHHDLQFQLSRTRVSPEAAEPAAEAFTRMTQDKASLSTETVVVELAAPSLIQGDAKACGIDPRDLPPTLPVALRIIAPDTRQKDVAAWLQRELPKAQARLVFLVVWIGAEGLKPNLPGLELRGWLLPELDALIVFDEKVFASAKAFFGIEDAAQS